MKALRIFTVVGLGLLFLGGCGDKPTPPGPTPTKTFYLNGKFTSVKGTAKTVSLDQAKLAATMALKNLEP